MPLPSRHQHARDVRLIFSASPVECVATPYDPLLNPPFGTPLTRPIGINNLCIALQVMMGHALFSHGPLASPRRRSRRQARCAIYPQRQNSRTPKAESSSTVRSNVRSAKPGSRYHGLSAVDQVDATQRRPRVELRPFQPLAEEPRILTADGYDGASWQSKFVRIFSGRVRISLIGVTTALIVKQPLQGTST